MPDKLHINQEEQHWPTAIPSTDKMGLGQTPGQRGAEILAGLRAELLPSPETKALSTLRGRAASWAFMRLEKSPAALNYVALRLLGLSELVRRMVPTDGKNLLLVDIAAGFSPRGYQLAMAFPDAQVIEVDLPDVIAEKQARLKQSSALQIPPNLSWLAADLGVVPLSDVLEGAQANAISAEGLNAYFAPADITRIASHFRACLKPGGAYVSDIPWTPGMEHARTATRFFSRQAGEFRGIVDDAESMQQLMLDAGYAQVDIYQPSEMAEQVGAPTPVLDFPLFVSAKTSLESAEPA